MKYSKQENYLINKDKLLKKIIEKNGSIKFSNKDNNYFHELVGIVISQFISTRAAESIKNKILDHFNSIYFEPKQFEKLNISEIKNLGLSLNKAKSILDITILFSNPKFDSNIHNLSEKKLDDTLLSLFGIGPWSLSMFKLFSLGYEDIFSCKDAALIKAMEVANMVMPNSSEDAYERYASGWSPYRSTASIHLWRSLS